MKGIYFFAIAFGVFLSTTVAYSQNINSIQTRLDRMEREMQTLSRSIYKGDVPPPEFAGSVNTQAQAATEQRLSQLEDQLRRLTGMIEETSYRLRQLEGKVDNASGQRPSYSEDRNLSSSNTSDISGIESQPLTIDNRPYQLGTITQGQSAMTPEGLYDKSFSFLQTNDYASAQAGFEEFIAEYPDHSLAANSKYWLGETFYARGDYSTASKAFARSFKDHPEGQKAPDTLLKLAMSLKSQNMKDEACLTLEELKNRFSNAPVSILSKADTERADYGC